MFLRILTPFLFIAAFMSGCLLSARLSNNFLEAIYMRPVPEGAAIPSTTMVFINNGDDVVMMSSICAVGTDCFEQEKKEWSSYSFLMPKDKEDFYRSKVSAKKNTPFYHFTVEQISDDRQRFKVISEGSHSSTDFYYEATDKEIYPIKYLQSEDIIGKQFLVMILGGLTGCGVFYLIYKRFIKPKFTS